MAAARLECVKKFFGEFVDAPLLPAWRNAGDRSEPTSREAEPV
jgi:hypothetical protein